MLAGWFRFICCNGLVCGSAFADIRCAHRGDIQGQVIDGACRVLEDFTRIEASIDAMKARPLTAEQQQDFAEQAPALRFGARPEGQPPVPVTAAQVLAPHRAQDASASAWDVFQRVQENLQRGGLIGHGVRGQCLRTREVTSIDRTLHLNSALWDLAEQAGRSVH